MVNVWDKLSNIFEHLGNKKKGTGVDYYNYNEFVPSEIQQRRSHLRIELFLPLNFWRIIRKTPGVELCDETLKRGDFQRVPTDGGMGLNLSGSGVLIISSQDFAKDDYIEIDDRIFGRQMNIYGRVIRAGSTMFDNNKICEFAVNFIKIKESDYEYLVRSIFDKIKTLRNINRKDYLNRI
ncbi:MAG TPA: PilZ domain-containing protein [Candidatus Wallbacteria bacterium]|nr:MAG: hypothetical protein BWY32_02862 [bacterium ADurb.Bin243]HOD39526.1 PilZ domain-containing protein [Candidatus Wallbacteria bacterium]HPG57450.1 PilZ domain-containing protein [Candidatus Wallbacteria bacterium]